MCVCACWAARRSPGESIEAEGKRVEAEGKGHAIEPGDSAQHGTHLQHKVAILQNSPKNILVP